LYIIKTDKIHVVLRHVKQEVFVLLSVVYMHPFKWIQLCVVVRLVQTGRDVCFATQHEFYPF